MQNLKKQIEIYFNDNWTDTPVQYQGSSEPDTDTFIYITFVPLDRSVYGMDSNGGRKKDTVMARIFSYSSNPLKSLEIDDSVREFFECWELPGIDARTQTGVPDGLGIVDLGNGMFETTSNYTIESYN